MHATCAGCGADFEAKTHRAKYCSGACKKRVADARKRGGDVVRLARPVMATQSTPQPDEEGPLAQSLRSSFKEADLTTPAGRVALRLCADVDALTPGVPGYASIVAQMRAAIDDLRTHAKPKTATPLTLLRERRAADRAAGTG